MTGDGQLRLDRMAIEEAGPNPERMAAVIHEQLALPLGPTPILEIAKALDIVEIREAPLVSFEAALITPLERGEGSIIVNARSSERRRLFSVAHELGHFLNPWHRPLQPGDGGGFACRKEDLAAWTAGKRPAAMHILQETQANRFAIEVLAPKKFFRAATRGIPDLDAVLRLSGALNLSKEATARRYAELHEQPTALIFTRNGCVRYVDRQKDFPFVILRSGQPAPSLPPPEGAGNLSSHVEADWRDWLGRYPDGDLVVQTLHQQNDFAITLLAIDQSDDSDEE